MRYWLPDERKIDWRGRVYPSCLPTPLHYQTVHGRPYAGCLREVLLPKMQQTTGGCAGTRKLGEF